MSTVKDLTIVVSLILLVGLTCVVKNETTVASSAEPQILTGGLRSGDIIFRHGPSIESGVVMTMDQSNFSHAGIVLRQRDETFVIHVVTGEGGPNITKIEPIRDYLRSDRATTAIAYRAVPENPALVAHAVEAARKYAERQVPFDSDFDLSSDRALYCTELVWRAYQEAGLDLVDEPLDQPTTSLVKTPILWPSFLLRSKQLKPVWEWKPEKKEQRV